MNSEAIADIELFNEKASLLLGSTFASAMLNNQHGYMFAWNTNSGAESVLVGPEGESVDAAFLTIRMFIQNNDRISIGNIAKIYSICPKLNPFCDEFNSIRAELNNFLDSKIAIDFFGEHYTQRETIELILYGSKGHSNREKEAKLKQLMHHPIISNLYLAMVNIAAVNFIKGIAALSNINKKALQSI